MPDHILRVISLPTIDHRGPEFGALGLKVLAGIARIFKTRHPVVIFPSSGTGAWEAALVNTMSAGDHVLMYETGHFASLWARLAERLGLKPEILEGRGDDAVLPEAPGWRHGVDAVRIEERLQAGDTAHRIKALCVVHNETSTGVTSDIAAVRRAIDGAGHPALLMVDSISGLASADYRHDEWGVDVTISGSQKGLMLPPGIGFNALSPRAIETSKSAGLPRSYWAWDEMLESNKTGYFPSTPNTNLLYGLSEALEMLEAEGLDAVFARHKRWAAGVRGGYRSLGPADSMRRSGAAFTDPHRCHPAGLGGCRCGARRYSQTLRHVAGRGAGQAEGPHVPHRPSGQQQRSHLARHPGRLRNGT